MKNCILLIFSFVLVITGNTQMITGVWKGKINHQKVEVKIIQKGDSLTGTSYYYESTKRYRRYNIKGYFDAGTNQAVWWDDQLIEEQSGKGGPQLSKADFNCPGSGKMMLDGRAGPFSDPEPQGDVDLDKTTQPVFADEWDFVIDNFTAGANDPAIIDSIEELTLHPVQANNAPITADAKIPSPIQPKLIPPPIVNNATPTPVKTLTAPPVVNNTIEEKLLTRKKIFTTEIPLTSDSIELRFYDNAEIDGDSISLFLNDQLIFRHIRLLASAYTIRLAVADLHQSNELVMVAENLGSIPPNTSYMVAISGGKRYEARLESTEGSSAMIRLVKE